MRSSRGLTKRTERPGYPGRSRFGSLLLVDHRLSDLRHLATNEPSANVYLDGETTLYTIHPITLHTSKAFSCFPTKNSIYFDFFRQNILSSPPFMPHILFQDEFSSAIGGSFLWRRHPSYRKRYGGKDYGEEDSGAQHLLR